MRVCAVLFVLAAVLVANSDIATSAESKFKFNPVVNSESLSPKAAYTTHLLSAHDTSGVHKKSLRRVDVGNAITKDDEDEEERAGGTAIVQSLHNLPFEDAKMVRQIAKGNSAHHILDKKNVPYELINGERVYSRENKIYAKYVFWLKHLPKFYTRSRK